MQRCEIFAAILAGALTVSGAGAAGAESFPDRPVKVIVPYAAGSVPDVQTRLIVEKMRPGLGQAIVVENRPGAGGAIGTALGARARPDGYTITLGGSPAVNAMLLRKDPGFDIVKDFVPIGLMTNFISVLVVNPAVPAKSVKELVAYAKANPGKVRFASGGPSTPSHLGGESFKARFGLDMVHVPYLSTPPAVQALVTGEAQVSFMQSGVVVPQIAAGNLRALAVLGTKRMANLPGVPTSAEGGVDFILDGWIGLLAPKGTPPNVVARLNAELNKALAAPEIAETALKAGGVPIPGTPADMAAHIERELKTAGEIVKSAKIEKQ